jgi:hypothetical protein
MKKLIFSILRTYDIGPLFGGEVKTKLKTFVKTVTTWKVLGGFRGPKNMMPEKWFTNLNNS